MLYFSILDITTTVQLPKNYFTFKPLEDLAKTSLKLFCLHLQLCFFDIWQLSDVPNSAKCNWEPGSFMPLMVPQSV